jgi:hypothetical protein
MQGGGFRRGGYGGYGGGYGGYGGGYGGYGGGYGGYGYDDYGPGIVGGLIAGSVLGLGYGADYGGYDDSYAYSPAPMTVDAGYCAQRYHSYDPASGTYLGYDGQRHPCQ